MCIYCFCLVLVLYCGGMQEARWWRRWWLRNLDKHRKHGWRKMVMIFWHTSRSKTVIQVPGNMLTNMIHSGAKSGMSIEWQPCTFQKSIQPVMIQLRNCRAIGERPVTDEETRIKKAVEECFFGILGMTSHGRTEPSSGIIYRPYLFQLLALQKWWLS